MKVEYHNHIVPGLDVLIGDPSILTPTKDSKKRADFFHIPEGYVYRAIDFYHEQSGRGDACRELTRRFEEILGAIRDNGPETFELENGTLVSFVKTPPTSNLARRNRLFLQPNIFTNTNIRSTIA